MTPTMAAEADPRRWLILAVIAVAQLMVVLDATIVNIELPSAQRDLSFSTPDRQWVLIACTLAFGGLLLLGGRLSDLIGRRTTFIAGLIGSALASAAGGAAPGFDTLIAARAVHGTFGAILAPSALALLTTTFTDARERARALGVYTAVAGAGGAVGLLLGGILTEYLSWRWSLYVNVVFALAALTGALAAGWLVAVSRCIVRRPLLPRAVPTRTLGHARSRGAVAGCTRTRRISARASASGR